MKCVPSNPAKVLQIHKNFPGGASELLPQPVGGLDYKSQPVHTVWFGGLFLQILVMQWCIPFVIHCDCDVSMVTVVTRTMMRRFRDMLHAFSNRFMHHWHLSSCQWQLQHQAASFLDAVAAASLQSSHTWILNVHSCNQDPSTQQEIHMGCIYCIRQVCPHSWAKWAHSIWAKIAVSTLKGHAQCW